MTPSTKPVRRLTPVYVRERGLRPLVITVVGSIIILRAKGCRREETLPIEAAYHLAVKSRVLRQRAEKRQSKKGKS